MSTVAVVGASGFVGSEVRRALLQRGVEVVTVRAPRVETGARELGALLAEIERLRDTSVVRKVADRVAECDAVINAAGLAIATGQGNGLFGANALMPGLLAAVVPDHARFVHISSAGVQGRRRLLDESEETAPFSPYTASKALGESVVLTIRPHAICYRPTSVHGSERDMTRTLVRVLRSPLASVAGAGDMSTPQVRVENVGDAAAFIATTEETPPRIVLHVNEGVTTAGLVRLLGSREPFRLPEWLARWVVGGAFLLGRAVPPGAGIARRLEMLWFGQAQRRGWLDERWTPVKGIDSWKELA
jgi:nucleoside-diphosphate-sugar epimerase